MDINEKENELIIQSKNQNDINQIKDNLKNIKINVRIFDKNRTNFMYFILLLLLLLFFYCKK